MFEHTGATYSTQICNRRVAAITWWQDQQLPLILAAADLESEPRSALEFRFSQR